MDFSIPFSLPNFGNEIFYSIRSRSRTLKSHSRSPLPRPTLTAVHPCILFRTELILQIAFYSTYDTSLHSDIHRNQTSNQMRHPAKSDIQKNPTSSQMYSSQPDVQQNQTSSPGERSLGEKLPDGIEVKDSDGTTWNLTGAIELHRLVLKDEFLYILNTLKMQKDGITRTIIDSTCTVDDGYGEHYNEVSQPPSLSSAGNATVPRLLV